MKSVNRLPTDGNRAPRASSVLLIALNDLPLMRINSNETN
jgi:hypothetical protein